MASNYTKQVLRVVVAQICQKIGWHNIQATPLDVLTDLLHRYMANLSTQIRNCSEFCDRLVPDLRDVALAFQNNNIQLEEIGEYVKHVDSFRCSINVPVYPIHNEDTIFPPPILIPTQEIEVNNQPTDDMPLKDVNRDVIDACASNDTSIEDKNDEMSLTDDECHVQTMRMLSGVSMSECGELQQIRVGIDASSKWSSTVVSDDIDSDDVPIAHLVKSSPEIKATTNPKKQKSSKKGTNAKTKKCTKKIKKKLNEKTKKLEVEHSQHKLKIFRRLHIKTIEEDTMPPMEDTTSELPLVKSNKKKDKKQKKKASKKKKKKNREAGC